MDCLYGNSVYILPNIRRRGIFPMASNKDKETMEAAYKIVQNMPKEIRKDFLKACEEIK
jgi:hypothetical protein